MNSLCRGWKKINSLPDDWQTQDDYKLLKSLATFYAEQAKIELSSDDSATIAGETGVEDSDGEEIYLDVAIDRKSFSVAIDTARATIDKSGLTAGDIDKIIFIGDRFKSGGTVYALRRCKNSCSMTANKF